MLPVELASRMLPQDVIAPVGALLLVNEHDLYFAVTVSKSSVLILKCTVQMLKLAVVICIMIYETFWK